MAKVVGVELTQDEEKFAVELQAKMDKIGLDTADKVEAEPEATPEPEEKEVESDEEVQAENGEEEVESTPEKTDDSDGDKGIPDALYRAAVHQGWKPEEIAEFVKATPELATRTFERMYESTNRISTEFARFGRLKVQDQGGAAESEVEKPAIDLADLKEQFGEDSAIVKFAQALTQTAPKAEVPAAAPANQGASDENTRQMINQFFTADTMKLYKGFYGEGADKNKLTYEQVGNRHKALEMADFILSGAEAQGRKMDVAEALERAHLCVTEAIRAEIIRKDITAKVEKKAKGVSLKPSSIKQSQPVVKEGKDLEQLVEQKMSKIFRR